jgi:hypothetical protein
MQHGTKKLLHQTTITTNTNKHNGNKTQHVPRLNPPREATKGKKRKEPHNSGMVNSTTIAKTSLNYTNNIAPTDTTETNPTAPHNASVATDAHHKSPQQTPKRHKMTRQQGIVQFLEQQPFSRQYTQLHSSDPSNNPGSAPSSLPSKEPSAGPTEVPCAPTLQQPQGNRGLIIQQQKTAAPTQESTLQPARGTKRHHSAISRPRRASTRKEKPVSRSAEQAGPSTSGSASTGSSMGNTTKKCRRGTPGKNTKIPPSKNSKAPQPTAEDKAAAFNTKFGTIAQQKPEGSRRLIFSNIGPGGLQEYSESAIQAKQHFIDQHDPDLIGWCEVGAYWPKIPQHNCLGELFNFHHKVRYVMAHNTKVDMPCVGA